ncbi:MAG TPA: formate dehydrogenase subunit alpha, partial [Bryobacterales bacterium]|nr:formate dehydrogenase subunit alpha [Bryobacterales bacterium]
FDDPVRESSCVACGECVMACPAGALMPKTLLDTAGHGARANAGDVVETVCPYCGVGCRLEYHVRDRRIVMAEGADGPANAKRLCVKGRFAFDYVSHPHRLTRPLIRKEGAPKGLNVDPANPFTHFREATWEEALDAAAAGFRRIRERHGPGALAGFGSAKGSNEEAYLFQKLVRTGFGTNNVDHCTRLCHASSVAALMEMIGSGAVTAPFTGVADSEVIMVIGANPTENHPVAATWIKQAVKRGAKLIVMDPRGQALKRHATLMLQFHAGSDVALLNAIMHVIMREGMVDEEFLKNRTHGWEDMKRHLSRFAPEPMSQLCGVPAKKIRSAAKFIGEARSVMFLWGMGVTQHVHGTDNARAIIDLALMTGNVGKPGAGLHPLRGQNNVQGASDAGLIPMVFPDYRPVSDPDARHDLEALWNAPLDDRPGLTVVEIMNAARAGDIRGMYIMGENPAMSDPDLTHTRAALAGLEHLVVQDIFPTETAMFADVILPAAAWPEKRGTVTNSNRQIQMGRPAVPPPGEARPDWWIICEIARRLGLEWNIEGPQDVFAEMKRAMRSLDNITWERLEREGSVTYPCPAPDHPGKSIVFETEFPTPDGKARLVPVDLVPPDERPDGD